MQSKQEMHCTENEELHLGYLHLLCSDVREAKIYNVTTFIPGTFEEHMLITCQVLFIIIS